MIEEILPGLYRIEIPLPRNPLKAINSYLIKGDGRFLIIDTGMNREECMHEMLSSLERLDVDLDKADFFITHMHADHLGLVASLITDTSKVYFSELEASAVNFQRGAQHWPNFKAIFISHGFPEDELERAMEGHPGRIYSSKQHIEFCTLKEDDVIGIGDYSFRCIETPGHSPGHMCLYEPDKKLLISGDHILSDITPTIEPWLEMANPLKEYLTNLEKVYTLDVDLVLPGHRNIWNDHKGRILELQEHHKNRIGEMLAALEEGDKTAWEIAPYVTWDIECSSWRMFPSVQKVFAVGETISHLVCLEADGKIRRKAQNHKAVFSLE